jgi:hypothetical protein
LFVFACVSGWWRIGRRQGLTCQGILDNRRSKEGSRESLPADIHVVNCICLQNLRRELAAWRRLSHPNIASLLGTTTGFGRFEGMVGMVSLWMKNGSLYAYMRNRKDEPLSRRLLWVGFPHFSHHLFYYV